MSASADDQHEHVNDQTGDGVPGGDSKDNAYASRPSQGHIPIQSDDAPVEDPIDPVTADTDEQLIHDDNEAIDKSNIIGDRTRGAAPSGGYREPGDEEGLPGAEDGTSTV